MSFVKTTQLKEHLVLKYTLDIFNMTNTASFDIPIDNVSQNLFFNDFPVAGTPPRYNCQNLSQPSFYTCPTVSGPGLTNKTIRGPRAIQMSLALRF